jgi:tRNA (cytidine/uridine-2'-O-)-methyltransferase
VLFTTKSRQSAYDFQFMADDIPLCGKENEGVPPDVADTCDAQVRDPMLPQVRSMSVATTAALAFGKAPRQTATLPY